MKYTVEERCCTRDGMNIYGQICKPDCEDYPFVVLCHGFDGSMTSGKPSARQLAKAGIGSYNFAFCGGATDSPSDGDMLEMSVMTEVADLNVVLDEVKTWPEVDPKRIYLLGRSQGGLVAALTAVQRPEDVKALLMFYPGFPIPEQAREALKQMDELPESFAIFDAKVGRPYALDVVDLNVWEEIGKYKGPVLMIHGTDDEVVPLESSKKALDIYEDAELVILEKREHGFYGKALKEATEIVIEKIKTLEAE